MAREILLTGNVPREPAAVVFETAHRHLGDRLRRMPDGEQRGWVAAAWAVLAAHPAVDVAPGGSMTDADTPFKDMQARWFALREGSSPDDVRIEHFGLAETVADSYRQLRELKTRDAIPEAIRLQATLAGPATAGSPLAMPWRDALSVVERPLIAEVEAIAEIVPRQELAVQLDLAAELELEEWRRNPAAFSVSVIERMHEHWGDWTFDGILDSVARIAERVPDDAELGFHLCGVWHIDPRGGQDLQVHVDAANLLTEKVQRRIDYIHMPSVPEHGPDDYAKLAGLQLAPQTTLFLGLIHTGDGLEGARRRLEAARAVMPDFGVGHFCGLSREARVDPERLDALLELHRQVAEL